MVRHCLWKMCAIPGACIKPGLVRLPLCHKVNLLNCAARQPGPQGKFTELCSSAAVVSQSKPTELCSSAAVVPQSKSTEKWSSAGPFDHDVWYFRHQTNEHFNSMLFVRKNQPTVAPLSSHWDQHARPNYWRSYWREQHTHSTEGFDRVRSKFEFWCESF